MSSGWTRTNYSWYRFFLKKEFGVFFVIMLLCFCLRIFNFSSASLWVDEAYSLALAHQKTDDIIKTSFHDINPPLYGLAIRKWAKTFGYSLESIRFFSIVCSFLTAIVLYRIGRKFFNYLTAVTAVLFYSFSNLQIYYAEEARGYALAGFLCSVSVYYFLSYLRHKNILSLVWLCIVNILVLYTHYVAGFLFAAEALIAVLFFYNKLGLLLKYVLSQIIALGAFVLWLRSCTFDLNGFQVGWIPELSFEGVKFFFMQVFNHEVILVLLLVWTFVSLILFFIFKNKRKFKQYSALFILALIPLLLICISNQYYVRLFFDRYILFTTITMFIFFGFIFSSVRMHLIFKLVLISVYMYFAIATVKVDAFRNEEWNNACKAGEALTNENTSVILHPVYIRNCFDYYNLRWSYDNEHKGLEQTRDRYSIFPVIDTNGLKDVSGRLKDRIIFYSSHYWGGDNDKMLIENFLRKNFNETYFHQFWNVRLYVYEKKK